MGGHYNSIGSYKKRGNRWDVPLIVHGSSVEWEMHLLKGKEQEIQDTVIYLPISCQV